MQNAPMREVHLGIDCGTRSTKAVLRDAASGDVVGLGRAAHELVERDDGTREQDPGQWIAAARTAVGEALARAGAVRVAGIGVSGQQHGLVSLDERDRPVRPAKLWNDTTAAPESAELTRRLGGEERLLELIGNLMLPGYTAPKVAWLRAREPANYTRTRRICLPHDFLNLWLTGEYVTEPGDASGTAYLDVRERRYCDDVLAAIDDARDWPATLPRIEPSLSVVGHLRAESAHLLRLPARIPVSAGGGDNMCAAIGVDVVTEGPVAVSLGTSGTCFAYESAPAIDPFGEAAAFCDSTGAWLPLACTLNGTSATEWVRGLFALAPNFVDAALARAAPGASGVTFLPYLSGERTPNRPAAAGIFAGLRASHGRDDLVRAVVEGVTFGLAHALDALRRSGVRPTEITLVGGGATSDAWAQLCADVFDLPVARPALVEAAASGAARQAQWAVDGARPSSGVTSARRFEPRADPELHAAAERAASLRSLAQAGEL